MSRGTLVMMMVLLAAAVFGPQAVDANTVVSASVSSSGYGGGAHYSSWNAGMVAASNTGLLFVFGLFLTSVFLAGFALSATETEFNRGDVKFFRVFALFWSIVAEIVYIWALFAFGWGPHFYGFGICGGNFYFFLLLNLTVLGGMIWFTVYLVNKVRCNPVNSSGSSCGTTKKKHKKEKSSSSSASGTD